jgi:urease accessory protein
MVMTDQSYLVSPLALLRLQSWLSPVFPVGSYSYSHGLEWAVDAMWVYDRESLVDWLEADLRYGSGRNEAIFFSEASRYAGEDNLSNFLKLLRWRVLFAPPRNLRSSQRSKGLLV